MALRYVPYTAAMVGVQKAATSTLHAVLREHPGFARAIPKEIHFWDDENVNWSDPDFGGYARPARRRSERVALDSTPSYLFYPQALQRMRRFRPDFRLVAVFRDPVDRAFSAWNMEYGRRRNWPSFGRAVERADLSAVPPESEWRRVGIAKWDLVARGLYAQQLGRGLDLFPREQWLLLTFEQVAQDTAGTVNDVAEFIGLPRFEPETAGRRRWASPVDLDAEPVRREDVERLVSAYSDDLPAFAALTGLEVGGWTTSRVLAGDLTAADVADRLNAKAGLAARS